MKTKILEAKVEKTFEDFRLDKYIQTVFAEISRAKAQTLIFNNQVQVDSLIINKAAFKVSTNQKIKVTLQEVINNEIKPSNLDLDIVFEDEDLIVINKPVDLVVHPAAGHFEDTLVNALVYHFKELSKVNGLNRPGIVHRIDKDTSGLLVIAKNDEIHTLLAEDIKNKLTDRKYYALVIGEVKENKFIVDAPIGRSKKNRKKMAVVADGKTAKTEFEVVKRFAGFTLLKAKLFTGRTHQIRVHLAYINLPIVGDQLYGKKSKIKVNHQLLHAYQLELIHPRTKKKLIFKADLPEDFKTIITNLETP